MALVVLTLGAWGVTVYQARTMPMSMGIVAPDLAEPVAPVTADGGAAMVAMPGMAEMPGMAPAEPAAEPVLEDAPTSMSGMPGMSDGGPSWNLFVAFLVAWAVMMAAMMFPAAAPMLLLFQTVSAQRRARGGAFVPTWVFAAGYLLVWTAVGVVAYGLVQLGSDVASRLNPAERGAWAPVALGASLVLAGVYQFTPLKSVCLRHCQTPFGFVMGHWRDGSTGALRMGIIHGAYCLGCCWALFAVLVAAGVMSLAWMLLLTLVVFAEKVLPVGRRVSLAVGAAFLVLGVLVATRAVAMPWTV